MRLPNKVSVCTHRQATACEAGNAHMFIVKLSLVQKKDLLGLQNMHCAASACQISIESPSASMQTNN